MKNLTVNQILLLLDIYLGQTQNEMGTNVRDLVILNKNHLIDDDLQCTILGIDLVKSIINLSGDFINSYTIEKP